MFFAIAYGFRQWKAHLAQYLLLLVGFTLFAMLLSINLATAPSLFSAVPQWVTNTTSQYVTIGLRSPKDTLLGVGSEVLDQAAKAPGILNMVKVGQTPGAFRIDDKSFKEDIGFVDADFFSTLGIKGIDAKAADFDNQAYVSRAFERQWGQGSLLGKTLIAKASGKGLHIAGYIPDAIAADKKIGGAVWVSANNLAAFFEIGLPPTLPAEQIALIKKQLVAKVPFYYGVAVVKEGFEPADLQRLLNEEDAQKQEGDVSFSSNLDNMKKYVLPGVNFAPSEQSQMRKQWWVILVLSLMFGLINVLNLLSHGINQFLRRQGEFATRIAVGANTQQLARQVFLEQLPLLVPALLLGWLAAAGLALYSNAHALWPLPVSFAATVLALVVATLVAAMAVAISTSLPLLALLRKSQFSRSKSQDASPAQRQLSRLNLGAQLCFAGLSLLLAFAMLHTQWQVHQQEQFGVGLDTFELHASDGNDAAHPMNVPSLLVMAERGDVAITKGGFVSPISFPSKTAVAAADFKKDSPNINTLAVSGSFFSVIKAKMLAGGEPNRQGVVLNASAAQILGLPLDESSIGQTLFMEKGDTLGFEKNQAIHVDGIIDDLPHLGVLNKHQPMIYGLLDNLDKADALSFIVQREVEPALVQQLKRFNQDNGELWTLTSTGSVKEALAKLNVAMDNMVLLAMVLGGLVSLLSISSLYNQLEAQLRMRKRKFGVMLAVGARFHHLLGLLSLELLAVAMAAFVVVAALVWRLNDRLALSLNADLASLDVVALTLVLLLAVLAFCSLWALRRSLKRPIRELL